MPPFARSALLLVQPHPVVRTRSTGRPRRLSGGILAVHGRSCCLGTCGEFARRGSRKIIRHDRRRRRGIPRRKPLVKSCGAAPRLICLPEAVVARDAGGRGKNFQVVPLSYNGVNSHLLRLICGISIPAREIILFINFNVLLRYSTGKSPLHLVSHECHPTSIKALCQTFRQAASGDNRKRLRARSQDGENL
jgi:hypothetical protein